MEDRKSFLKKSLIFALGLFIPFLNTKKVKATESTVSIRTTNPRRALVAWYSQAGHTRRNGFLIARTLETLGLSVDALEIKDVNTQQVGEYDMIIIGSPVFYYDTPENVREWLEQLPSVSGAAIASYVTFGGEGGNQHNAAFSIIDRLTEKGGVPVGMAMFGNMSTFAPTWGMGNEERILAYRHLPNETTYETVRQFARTIHGRVRAGESVTIESQCDYRNIFRNGPSIWGTEVLITEHQIDSDRCQQCGTCEYVCPRGAISFSTGQVNSDRCIVCLGCLNNCPYQAIDMHFMGNHLTGFPDFLRQNNITIQEPEELRNT